MAFFKMKVGDKMYELEKLTLGESRVLKRDFGLSDLEFFSETDPDQLVGLMYLAMKRSAGSPADPRQPLDEAILSEIEATDIEEFVPQEILSEDPTPAADSGVHDGPVTGDPETTPSTPGDPSTAPN